MRKRDGKVATKLKWYGGLVTRVSTGGSKIRIKYDDGTSEVSKFPDKDVIVDDAGNGEHRVSAGRFIPPAQRAAAAAETAKESQHREEDDSKKKKTASLKKLERSSSKAHKEDEHERIKPALENRNEPPRPAKSPKKEKAKKQIVASPKHDAAHAASADEEGEDTHGDSDFKMDEPSGNGADTGDAHKNATGERKKPSLKIRLKGPKACIVASASHDSVGDKDHSSSEEEEHGDESSYEEDATSVEEEANEKRSVQHEEGGKEEESGAKSPYAATESTEEASQTSDVHYWYARKKRSHDRVSGDEISEGPPKRKRVSGKSSESESAEIEAEDVDQDQPRETERTTADDEEAAGDQKVSNNVEECAEVPPERKRKREEHRASQDSPRAGAKSATPEPAEFRKSTSDAYESKPESSEEETTKSEPKKRPKLDESEVAASKDSTLDSSQTLPSKNIEEKKDGNESDAARLATPPPSQEAGSSADDSTSKAAAAACIPRFGRRAAQQANERIAARKEIIIQDEFAKKKKHRKEKSELKLFAGVDCKGKSKSEESGDDEDNGVWVQCDDCSKWRLLPSSVQTSELPKHWYCNMNVYDPDRNTCDAPEQTAQEIAKEKRRRKRKLAKIARLEAAGKIDAETAAAQRIALDNKERKLTRSKERRASRSPIALKDSLDKDIQLEADKESGARTKRSSTTLSDERAESPTAETGSDLPKSRSYKKQSSFGSGGRKPRSDADDAENIEADVEVEPVPKKRGRGRPPRSRSNKDVGNKESDKGMGTKSGANDQDNQEWVQCELCQKWRRLPSHISADSLPDTWYCAMNTWDSRAANCDAEEDKADPNHHEFGIYGSGVSTASHGNKLSYRNLIFGTGRKQNRPVTERTRAAESLFLAPTVSSSDSICCPKVMYANSSVFMPRTSNAQKSNAADDEKRVSLFELMSHSNLWAELRAASNLAELDKLGSSIVNSSYDSLSAEMKQTMKQMVLHAIGALTLACDEVLLEAQCRQWTSVPQEWADLRASFTIDKVEGALCDLVADRIIESVVDETQSDLSTRKYRRVSAKMSTENKEARPTRCMKIAKPWKRARPNMAHEWLK